MTHENNSSSEDFSPNSVPDVIAGKMNFKQEEDEYIQAFANREQKAMIAIIAPYVSVRVSPVEIAYASLGLQEEFGIEALVEKLKQAKIKSAYLLVNSLGGGMASTYKIARSLGKILDNVVTFVPHIAASGGTLLALIGKEIVMGPMSHITPLDVQVTYKESTVSVNTFWRFMTRANQWFERITPQEAPYPRTALADKLDPFIMEEWSGMSATMMHYLTEILGMAGYGTECERIATTLLMKYPIHSYVITEEKAKALGLKIKDSSEYEKAWRVMRYWLGKYMLEEAATHCIRYALPETKKRIKTTKRKKKDKVKKND